MNFFISDHLDTYMDVVNYSSEENSGFGDN